MEQLQSMGLALVIFIAAYLKMSTPEITTRHTVLYSLPLWNYCTLKEIVLIKCLYLEFFGIFMIAMYIRTYAVSLRLTADEIQ